VGDDGRAAVRVREPGKHITYWVKRDGGWKVVAYKRSMRAPDAIDTVMMPPALPARIVRSSDTQMVRHRTSLDSVERAFSDGAVAPHRGMTPAARR